MKHILLIILLLSCTSEAKKEKPTEIPETADVRPKILMKIVDSEAIDLFIDTEGIVESAVQVKLVSRESGYLVQHKLVDGEAVKKGNLLWELDDRSLQLRIKEAEIAVQKAKRDMLIELNARKSANHNLDSKQEQLLRIQFGVDEAEIRLLDLQLSAKFMRFSAPFDGFLSIPVTRNQGDFIQGGTELGLLVDPNQNRLKLFVLQQDAALIKIGQIVFDDKAQEIGKISAISPIVGEKTQSVSVWVALNAQSGLRHGERKRARIAIEKVQSTIRVPRSSVLERDNRLVIFKNKRGQAQWVYVTVKGQNKEWAVVDGKGLAVGDTIAYDRHFTLSHLQKIDPILE